MPAWNATRDVPGHYFRVSDLAHLGSQGPYQGVLGPMQDDEALLLFALVRSSQVRRVLEIGGNDGFSARNFVAALRPKANATVYTIDLMQVPRMGPTHVVISKDAASFTASDIGGEPIDLLLLDCHHYSVQRQLVLALESANLFGHHSYIALHDTGLHSRKWARWSSEWRSAWQEHATDQRVRYVHQPVERLLASWLSRRGWQRISAHDDDRKPFPRHGLTLMQRLVDLGVPHSVEMRKEELTMLQTGSRFRAMDTRRRRRK